MTKPEVFPTEEQAMEYYKTNIRPRLEQMMSDLARQAENVQTTHRRLE